MAAELTKHVLSKVEGPALRDYRLADNLGADHGVVFLTGTQALVRLLLMQRRLDAARGLDTAGFVSGYRGSPLGMVDQQLWKAQKLLDAGGIRFLPAINEDPRRDRLPRHAARRGRSEAHRRWRLCDVVRQGPGRRSLGRCAEARQRLRFVGLGRRARRGGRRSRMRLVVDAAPGAIWRCRPGACRSCIRPTSPSSSSSGSTAGRCRVSRARGSASRRSPKWSSRG